MGSEYINIKLMYSDPLNLMYSDPLNLLTP